MRNSSTRPSSIVPRLDPLGRPHCQPDLIAPVMLDFDGPVTYLFINGHNRMVADQRQSVRGATSCPTSSNTSTAPRRSRSDRRAGSISRA